MPGKTAVHAIILTIATILIFFWVSDEALLNLSLQLSAVLLLLLIICHRILKPVSFRLAESTISTMAVLLITSATGGVSSPLFFLNYFLLFELSLLLEPVIPLVLSAGLIIFYFMLSESHQTPLLIAMIIAFPFMTPLAYIFGQLYQKEENQKKEIKNLSKKIESLEEELVEEEIR